MKNYIARAYERALHSLAREEAPSGEVYMDWAAAEDKLNIMSNVELIELLIFYEDD